MNGETFHIYCRTDFTFEAAARAGLLYMHSRDGKLVSSKKASLSEWVNFLELKHGSIKILEGQQPPTETIDPQYEIESAQVHRRFI